MFNLKYNKERRLINNDIKNIHKIKTPSDQFITYLLEILPDYTEYNRDHIYYYNGKNKHTNYRLKLSDEPNDSYIAKNIIYYLNNKDILTPQDKADIILQKGEYYINFIELDVETRKLLLIEDPIYITKFPYQLIEDQKYLLDKIGVDELYIRNLDQGLAKEYISQHKKGDVLKLVRFPSDELIGYAIEICGGSILQYIREFQENSIYPLNAILQYGGHILHLNNPSKVLIELAVFKWKDEVENSRAGLAARLSILSVFFEGRSASSIFTSINSSLDVNLYSINKIVTWLCQSDSDINSIIKAFNYEYKDVNNKINIIDTLRLIIRYLSIYDVSYNMLTKHGMVNILKLLDHMKFSLDILINEKIVYKMSEDFESYITSSSKYMIWYSEFI